MKTNQNRKQCVIARNAVFVSVTQALAGRVPDIRSNTPLCDIARGFWHVDDNKIKQCELLVAVEKGVVRGAWEIDMAYGWHSMSLTAIPTRNTTCIIVDPTRKYCRIKRKVRSELDGKKLSLSMNGMRMYGPVRYNF